MVWSEQDFVCSSAFPYANVRYSKQMAGAKSVGSNVNILGPGHQGVLETFFSVTEQKALEGNLNRTSLKVSAIPDQSVMTKGQRAGWAQRPPSIIRVNPSRIFFIFFFFNFKLTNQALASRKTSVVCSGFILSACVIPYMRDFLLLSY